jgi:uncharacterized protein YecE (DUF72 family)
MAQQEALNLESFQFRGLHPQVSMGTASDRYAGWIGQIYAEDRYRGRISARSHTVGRRSFREEVLPVESAEEYFQHFSVLELDFTFYGLLVRDGRKPTQTYRVLQAYSKYLSRDDRLILKVPQVVFAQRLWRGGRFSENPDYLNPDIFLHQFYQPATDLLGGLISGFIFEQEYQAKNQRTSPAEYVEALDRFLSQIPNDNRYHIETRTEPYLTASYFKLLQTHGIGQVLSHWTWLPPLRKQFAESGGRFSGAGGRSIIRLMTPLRIRYEDAYAKAFPFDRLVDGMMHPSMVEDTVEIISAAIEQGVHTSVVVNNRAGGNAPLIARRISESFLKKYHERSDTKQDI